MQSMTVRPMTSEDAPIVAAWMVTIPLWQRYRLTAAGMQAQFEQALTPGDDILLAADSGPENRACGFAWCVTRGAFGLSVYLRLIGVRPDCTRSGIGAVLMARAEQRALEVCDDLFLLVSDFNLDAQRFYRRNGYRQIGAIPGYVLPDVTELIFWKRLRSKSA